MFDAKTIDHDGENTKYITSNYQKQQSKYMEMIQKETPTGSWAPTHAGANSWLTKRAASPTSPASWPVSPKGPSYIFTQNISSQKNVNT